MIHASERLALHEKWSEKTFITRAKLRDILLYRNHTKQSAQICNKIIANWPPMLAMTDIDVRQFFMLCLAACISFIWARLHTVNMRQYSFGRVCCFRLCEYVYTNIPYGREYLYSGFWCEHRQLDLQRTYKRERKRYEKKKSYVFVLHAFSHILNVYQWENDENHHCTENTRVICGYVYLYIQI